MIDSDSKGELLPHKVMCNMTDKNGVGVTVISHDSENRTPEFTRMKGFVIRRK